MHFVGHDVVVICCMCVCGEGWGEGTVHSLRWLSITLYASWQHRKTFIFCRTIHPLPGTSIIVDWQLLWLERALPRRGTLLKMFKGKSLAKKNSNLKKWERGSDALSWPRTALSAISVNHRGLSMSSATAFPRPRSINFTPLDWHSTTSVWWMWAKNHPVYNCGSNPNGISPRSMPSAPLAHRQNMDELGSLWSMW